jgi:HpaII restriction endonuclease
MQTLNRGEWSESYCIVRVIADGALHLCDATLTPNGDMIVVVGGRLSESVQYSIRGGEVWFHTPQGDKVIPLLTVSALATETFTSIKTSRATFSIPAMQAFFSALGEHSIKSIASKKVDAVFSVLNTPENIQEERGFSIKSFVAGSPTLVNASSATNFTYHVELSLADTKYRSLKAKTLLRALLSDGVEVLFESMDNPIYKRNLMVVDSQLPAIMAEVLKLYFSSRIKYMRDFIPQLEALNPLQLDDVSLYRNKIADFLFYSAVGMFPNTPWEGVQAIDGGCLIVKETGDVSTFYIFRKASCAFFREYLLNHCFLDTASTSRHGFARLYHERDTVKLKLNLQVRIAKH